MMGVAFATALLLGLSQQGRAETEAQEFQPRLELGVLAGGHIFSETSALGREDRPRPTTHLSHSGAVGGHLGFWLTPRLLPEMDVIVVPTDTASHSTRVTVLNWGAQLAFHFLTERVRPFVMAGVGGMSTFSDNQVQIKDSTLAAFRTGLGLKFDITEHVGFRLDGRLFLMPEIRDLRAPDFEFLGGLYGLIPLGPKPVKPPPEPTDSDKDGLLDPQDKCPAQPGPKENQGCPDVDGDNDGIIDRLDKCPAQAGPRENQGCPDVDTDADGMVDRLDKCPQQAGPKDNDYCPDTDEDGDGVVDRLDKCVKEPETRNNYQDEDGCPDEIPQAVKKFTGTIEGIFFETGKAIIKPASFVVLDKAVAVLKEYPDVRLEIQGHTDNVGKRDMNLDLSQRRAEAVREYFVNKGVSADRLRATGYGPDRPIADNKTKAGKSKNRRVEFQLISAADAASMEGTPAQQAPAAPPAQQAPPAQPQQ
jgi:OOP family OmpA-OmpF porin